MEEKKEIYKDTPWAMVHEILVSGEFADNEDTVGDDETPIGELTDFEKALSTAANRVSNDNNAALKAAIEKGEPLDDIFFVRNRMIFDALESMLWAVIRYRLYAIHGRAIDDIGIRKGHIIVENPPSAEKLIVNRLLSLKNPGIIAIGIGVPPSDHEHNCDGCPKGEECEDINSIFKGVKF